MNYIDTFTKKEIERMRYFIKLFHHPDYKNQEYYKNLN